MKKLLTLAALLVLVSANSQIHRFYYEMTYRSHKDSIMPEKEIMVLDVAKDESLFLSQKQLEFDSTYIAGVRKAKESGVNFISPPSSNFKKWSFRINKLKKGKLIFNDFIGMSEYYNYEEKPDLKWNVINFIEKIGGYETQMATTSYGGRNWTAWFTTEVPIQDGPYKFSGLPGLIVKLEDKERYYSWLLIGNKKLAQDLSINRLNNLEFQMGKSVKLSKEGFQKRLGEYEKNPISQMMQMFDEKDVELMKALKQQEIRIKKQIALYNNPIETK
jgi:GLPGLI family protein